MSSEMQDAQMRKYTKYHKTTPVHHDAQRVHDARREVQSNYGPVQKDLFFKLSSLRLSPRPWSKRNPPNRQRIGDLVKEAKHQFQTIHVHLPLNRIWNPPLIDRLILQQLIGHSHQAFLIYRSLLTVKKITRFVRSEMQQREMRVRRDDMRPFAQHGLMLSDTR